MEKPHFSERETEYMTLHGLMRYSESGGVTGKLVRAALNEDLTPRQSQMVRLYYIEQKTMPEIARQLGGNISTVSRTLAAARVKLKRSLWYARRSQYED